MGHTHRTQSRGPGDSPPLQVEWKARSRGHPGGAVLPPPTPSRAEPSVPPSSPTRTGHCPLTAECGAPPGRRHPRLAAVTGIGFQGVTEAGIGQRAGATGTQVIHTGSKEGLRRHHSVAATERGGLQHPTPGIGLTPGSETCCPARIHLAALRTWPARSRPFWDLGGKSDPDVTASTGS